MRLGHTAPWMLVTRKGFLQYCSRASEEFPRKVVGVPALEVALHGLTTSSIDADTGRVPVPEVE